MGESIACGVEHEVHDWDRMCGVVEVHGVEHEFQDWHRMCSVGEVQGHVRKVLRREEVEHDVRAVQPAQDREQEVPPKVCCGRVKSLGAATTLSAGRGRFAWHRAVCGAAEVQEHVPGVLQGDDGEGDVQDLPDEEGLQQKVPAVECDRE